MIACEQIERIQTAHNPLLAGSGPINAQRSNGVATVTLAAHQLPIAAGAKSLSLAVKRAADLVLAVILCVFLAPLFVLIAAGVKLESNGPVFFRQARRGQRFGQFTLLKFRSMRIGVPDPHEQYETLRTDPRITRVGALLRRTSMDELPQLYNVLAGSMSLVGPRPLVEWESQEALRTHSDRFAVKPGITGLSQISVRNGVDFCARLDRDIEYVRRWSLILDVAILLKTPLVVLFPQRIYPSC